MAYYVLTKNEGKGNLHTVHRINCEHKEITKNQFNLGFFDDEIQALNCARLQGYNADGCKFCCPQAHLE